MWLGTNEGLNKYDGYNFIVYKNIINDSTSISDNWILSLFEDKDSIIWIGTLNGGLNKFDPKTEKFTTFKKDSHKKNTISNNNIYSIAEDSVGNLWIGTDNGLNKMDRKTETFQPFLHLDGNSNSLPGDSINIIYISDKNSLWIGTEDAGISHFDLIENKFTNYTYNPANPNGLCNNSIWGILKDPDKTEDILWVATNGGLNKLSLKDNKFLCFKNKPENPNSLSSNFIRAMALDKDGNIWLGTRDKGLSILLKEKKDAGYFINYLSDIGNPQSLSTDYIYSIYMDRSNIGWIGTRFGGINKVINSKFELIKSDHSKPGSLLSNSVMAILKDSEGNLWIGTDKGLDLKKSGSDIFTHFQSNLQNQTYYSNDRIHCIFEDSQKNIWIGTENRGLNKYDKKNQSFKTIQFTDPKRGLTGENFVTSLLEDNQGYLWISTKGGGLFKYKTGDKTIKSYKNNPSDPNSLISNRINIIRLDSCNRLWIGTSGSGLDMLDLKTDKFTHLYSENPNFKGINDKYVISIFVDSNGIIWIGTYNGGLNKYNPTSNIFEYFTTENGLPNNLINSIIEDNEKNLWIGTNQGLSKLNTNSNFFSNFDASSGIQGCEFYANSCYKDDKGILYFGGINGFNIFDPQEIKAYTYFPPVIITDFKLFNNSIKPSENSPLSICISETKEIKVSRNDNMISLQFIALNYGIQNRLYYAYKLEGFDKNWNYTDHKNRIATYTNLESGVYEFKVKATSSKGAWGTKETSLKVIITEPFFKTKWIYITLIIFLIIFITIIFRYKFVSLKREYLKLKIQSQKTTEELIHQKNEISAKSLEYEQQREESAKQHDNLIESKAKIDQQNLELENHRNHLEKLVQLRTIDLENAKNKAETADKLKSSFLANMSHEIRTPMNGIIGFSNLLGESEITTDQKANYIKHINSSCKTLLNLIDDIIDIAKFDAGEINITKQSANLSEIINELYTLYTEEKKHQFKDKIQLKTSIPEKELIIFTDPQRLRQLLSQLLDNALKFTHQGEIVFGYEIQETKIQFFVKDTGIGISKEDFDSIFDRFTKGQTDNSKLYRGAGLGLAISKSIAEMLGGQIWVKSQKGEGSTFYFALPMDRSIEKIYKKPDVGKTVFKYNWKDKKILIAEDEETNFKFLEAALQKTNVQLMWAKNGKEAVEIVKKGDKINLILMDIKMPAMDGYQATILIKKWKKDIPVIAQTAYTMLEEKDKSLAAGCDDYVTKPISVSKLLEKIDGYFSENPNSQF
jgi:signal transduction histidine kinase/ligand-binding sensor domain-containing protein/CheY-like chemotaxis protein